jgi:UDP-GlcNAc3NAcA epimerase
MPEEVNRLVADRVSSLLFCSTDTAVANLRAEGIVDGVHQCGDVMFDVSMFYRERARTRSTVIRTLGLDHQRFALATCHRAENTDDRPRLEAILSALQALSAQLPVVLPIHPRTRKVVADLGLKALLDGVRVIEPQSFLDMIALEQAAALVLTDSGGVQKEAFFFGVPCVTLRDETEWVETVAAGANTMAGADRDRIITAAGRALAAPRLDALPRPYGDGDAARRIVQILTAA